MFVTDLPAYLEAAHVFVERFAGAGIPVACSLIGVTGLATPGLMVEVEALAVR
jgi:enamine deaminase RidA (YjgF/YER057c/UK114 family)